MLNPPIDLPTLDALPDALRNRVRGHLDRCTDGADPALVAAMQQPAIAGSLPLVWASSEFVAQSCLREPALLPRLLEAGMLLERIDIEWQRNALAAALQSVSNDTEFQMMLRRFRRQQMVRIAWRDIAGWAALDETLLDVSNLADVCVECVYRRAYDALSALYGLPRGADSGEPQQLMVLGMGKLGGRELNYSSDIDLIFLYDQPGQTDGAASGASIDNQEFFLRLGQRMVQWLSNATADGFVFRVDMRLRPFGDSGPLVVTFDGLEHYLQQHGRDWERYAYVKARPLTAIELYPQLYANVIRPFVYRRYLDFAVFASLREMKQMIVREVARRELHDNIKLGPGGIREVEFITQSFQLLRGGHDRTLQSRELQTVLPQLVGSKLLKHEAVESLLAAYRFLRRVENRLQQWNDQAEHKLPADEAGRLRLALSLGYGSWSALNTVLTAHRTAVSALFAEIIFGVETASEDTSLTGFLDPQTSTAEREQAIAALGLSEASEITALLMQVRDSGYYRSLDEVGHQRLHALVPRVMKQLAAQAKPLEVMRRILRIIEKIGRRTVYLALLNDHPPVLARLVQLCAASEFLADQIAAFPLLLDELLDERALGDLPDVPALKAEMELKLRGCDAGDMEREVELLCEFKRVAMFRIAVADLSGHLPLMRVSDHLTELAALIVNTTLRLAWQSQIAKHGVPQCGEDAASLRTAGVVVVAYGKFGGIELGYGSDLDLVFLHDSAGAIQMTNGEQSIDNSVFFARLGQRLVHLLTTHTRAGRLYEVDVRLRPSGKGGLLVQSLNSFEQYQRQEAWTWEHQALLRARAVAGDAAPMARFEEIRIDILRHGIRRDTLREEVRKMRERMRTELSKAKPGRFDLKQDAGGIADIEFLVQYWMLKWADDYPPIIIYSDNIRQLESLASGAIVPQTEVDFLTATYRKYRERMHHLSLAGEGDVIEGSEFLEERRQVVELWNRVMLRE